MPQQMTCSPFNRRKVRRITLAVEELRLISVASRTATEEQITSNPEYDLEESLPTSSPEPPGYTSSPRTWQLDLEKGQSFARSDQSALTLADSKPSVNTKENESSTFVAVSVQRRQSCQPWCSCCCHAQSYFSTPTMLSKVFGNLFIGYSGSIVSHTPCNVKSCASRSSHPRARATYFFPDWFYSKAIDAAFYRGPFGDLSANISLMGVQGRNSSVFKAVAIGDIPQLQDLFSEGLARPTDVDPSGTTLVFAAVAYRQRDVVKFLLSAGADEHYPNRDRISAFDRAWDGIITCHALHDPSRHVMRELFNDTGQLDTWQLSRVHKVVLGLLQYDLREELDISTSEIDSIDSHDRTPLWWAVAIASRDHVQTLLEYGANPNIPDCEGAPPLRKATAADNLDIFLLLLKHGADPNWRTLLGMQISHTVMSYNLDIRYLEASLNPSLDLNARGGYSGNTPLLIAVNANNVRKVEWLLEQGVDVNKRDQEGYTPLILAVVRNYGEIVSLLLRYGADATLKDAGCRNVIALAAGYAVRDTLNILAAFGVAKGIDLDGKINKEGTTRDLVHVMDFDAGGRAAFWRLLNTQVCDKCAWDARAGISASVSLGLVSFSRHKSDDVDDDEDREEFHDASETQPLTHTHPDLPEGLLDNDLAEEDVIVDEDGRVFVRSVFAPDMWMLQQPGQDLVRQHREMKRQLEKAIMNAERKKKQVQEDEDEDEDEELTE